MLIIQHTGADPPEVSDQAGAPHAINNREHPRSRHVVVEARRRELDAA
jgi:hypothetical protein